MTILVTIELDICINCKSMKEREETALNRARFWRTSMAVKIDIIMPKNCSLCPISKFSPATHILFCGVTNRKIEDDLKKSKFCPLKEVK